MLFYSVISWATDKNGEFCWNDLRTNDVKKAKEFYAKLLGWTYEDVLGDKPYTLVSCGGMPMGGIVDIPSEVKDKVPPHWMSYVNVDDLVRPEEVDI